MSLHPLAGVVAKIRRADAHLESLYVKIGEYLRSCPHEVIPERDPNSGHGSFVLRVTKEPPLDIAAIVGDVLHNFSSALDYIVAEIIQRNGFPVTRITQFPVCRTEDDFFNESINLGKLTGVTVHAFNRIRGCQPYRFGADKVEIHPLWVLRKLSNFDKHRAINISALGTRARWRYIGRDGTLLREDHLDRLMYNGEKIGSMPVSFIDSKAKIESQITTQVSFRNVPVADVEVLSALQAIRELFDMLVLPLLEPCFEPLPDDLKLVPNRLYEWSGQPGTVRPPNVPLPGQ